MNNGHALFNGVMVMLMSVFVIGFVSVPDTAPDVAIIPFIIGLIYGTAAFTGFYSSPGTVCSDFLRGNVSAIFLISNLLVGFAFASMGAYVLMTSLDTGPKTIEADIPLLMIGTFFVAVVLRFFYREKAGIGVGSITFVMYFLNPGFFVFNSYIYYAVVLTNYFRGFGLEWSWWPVGIDIFFSCAVEFFCEVIAIK
jgi:hypothetical protein